MINLALITSEADTDTSHDQQVDLYREKTVQCLFMGEYTKPGPYVLETIIQYVYVEFLLSPDADHDLWLLLSLEVNTALRMGYHRDPSHFAHIDAFQGEMRRRVWSTVRLGDILISSQMGMPRMMAEWKCDTAEPRNLNDTDMAPGMAQLPSSRPETEYTTATGTIARGRLLKVLGTISDLISSTRRIGYDEVMRVDRALHEAAASLPAPCQMKPIAASITDTPQAIMGRIFSSHIYYRGQLILHHRFLHLRPPDESQDPFAYSRNACLEASLGSLQLQKVGPGP